MGTTTLDWSAVLRLDDQRDRTATLPSFVETSSQGRRACHVVVVGACEGEAILIGSWALARKAALERAVGADVRSLTWLATDIAPVGHFAEGTLRTAMIDAPLWVVVAGGARFARCATTTAIINTIIAGSLPYVTVSVDSTQDNVARHAPAGSAEPDAALRIATTRSRSAEWRGGTCMTAWSAPGVRHAVLAVLLIGA